MSRSIIAKNASNLIRNYVAVEKYGQAEEISRKLAAITRTWRIEQEQKFSTERKQK